MFIYDCSEFSDHSELNFIINGHTVTEKSFLNVGKFHENNSTLVQLCR